MFRRTILNLPKRFVDETKNISRRVRAQATLPMWYGREEDYTDRMKEMGPRYSKVWVALGGKMRRRRIGRQEEEKDTRFYWRPIERQYQRIYQRKLRQRDRGFAGKHREPMTLRPTNSEISKEHNGEIYWKLGPEKKYGAKYAVSKPLDFEFRVF